MDDLTNAALGGAIGFTLGEQAEKEQSAEAVRKWFKALPEATRARLIPLNPEIAEALTGEGSRASRDPYFPFDAPHAEPNPTDGHTFDGWAYDGNCVQCRRPEHEHRPKHRIMIRSPRAARHTYIRTGGVFAIGLGVIFNFVGLVLQLPGRALVVLSDALCKWAIVEDE